MIVRTGAIWTMFVSLCLDLITKWFCFCPDPSWSQSGPAQCWCSVKSFPSNWGTPEPSCELQASPCCQGLLCSFSLLNWIDFQHWIYVIRIDLHLYPRFLFDNLGTWKACQERSLRFHRWSPLSYLHRRHYIISLQGCLLICGGGCTELQWSVLILSFHWNLRVKIKA